MIPNSDENNAKMQARLSVFESLNWAQLEAVLDTEDWVL